MPIGIGIDHGGTEDTERAPLRTDLRPSGKKLGLLMDFNVEVMRDGITRRILQGVPGDVSGPPLNFVSSLLRVLRASVVTHDSRAAYALAFAAEGLG